MWAFCKNSGVFFFFFLPQRVQILQKRTLPWILNHFFVQKYIKFPIFQTSFARKQQFGGLFCRLGNLGGAMHPCTPPSNGHAFNMYLVIPYCTCTANPKLHKSDNCTKMQKAKLEFVYVRRDGCVVLLKSPFCVRHPIFTNISWDFDDLSTKTRHAKASTCRLHFGWECHCHRSKRYPPFESGLPPPLGVLFSPSS